MKRFSLFSLLAATLLGTAAAADIYWSASVHHGFSREDFSEVPVNSLVRLGYFRDPVSGAQLTDLQIRALKASPPQLDAFFIEVGRSTMGSGLTPAIAGHFAAQTQVLPETPSAALAGKQLYLWVLDAPTLAAASEHAILYWSILDAHGNPDGEADKPGLSWRVPEDANLPQTTTLDLTDLTVGTGLLASGARVVVGSYPWGQSTATGFPNFGLSKLEQPLVVTTPSLVAGGSVGVRYSYSLAVIEGRPGYSWSLTGGSLPHGLQMDDAGVISGVPSVAGRYGFTVRATDAKSDSVVQSLELVISDLPLVIRNRRDLGQTGLRAPYSINLLAEGGSKPLVWSLFSGQLPAGLTLSDQGLLSGSPTESGLFRFTFKCEDNGAQETTAEFQLEVLGVEVASAAQLDNAFVGRRYLQMLQARGGKAPYLWSLEAGALPDGMTLSPEGRLHLESPQVLGSTNFTLRVTDALGQSANRAFTFTVLGLLALPQLDPLLLPEVMVGESLRAVLSASNQATAFRASGLPAGLSFDPKTGVLSGKPMVSGQFTLKFRASNQAGVGPELLVTLRVEAINPGAVGSFMGVIAHNAGLNKNLGGRFVLETNTKGSFSLKVVQGSVVSLYSGAMDIERGELPRVRVIRKPMIIDLALDASRDALTGSITDLAPGGTSAAVAGWRQVWRVPTNPAIRRQGFYTMGLDLADLSGNSPVPMGTGFAATSVRLDGTLTIVGKTADGQGLTTAGFIGPRGEALVYQILYASGGSLVGRVEFSEDDNSLYGGNEVTGLLTWRKPRNSSRIYGDGFGPLTVSVYGRYLAIRRVITLLNGLPDPTRPVALNFAEGGVEQSATNPDVPALTIRGLDAVSMPAGGTAANPGRATLSLPRNKATDRVIENGIFRGSFQLVDGRVVRRASYEGMIIRSVDRSTKAYGFFLLPQLPVGRQTLSTSPILSGQVTITQPEPPQ